MTTITKEQIEILKRGIALSAVNISAHDANAARLVIHDLLNQPEPEPVAKLVLEDVCDFGDAKRLSISWLMEGYPPVGSFLYTHPPAPKAITADMVTDEMVKTSVFVNVFNAKQQIANVVNAFNGVNP